MLAYAVGGIAALLVLAVFLQFGRLTGPTIWVTVATAVVGVLGSFRYCKAFWTWLLYTSGELGGS